MNHNTFIFDFDFTLADASDGIVESANYSLEKLHIEAKSRDAICKTVGMSLKDTFFALTQITDDNMACEFAYFFREKADEVMTKSTALFLDTTTTLKKLKTLNYKTAIVTSKFHYRITEVLAKYNISNLIDYIVGFEDVDEAKPSPEGLFKAIKTLGSLPADTLYIGDSTIDANTAANAGVDFAAVTTGTTTKEEFILFPHITIAVGLTELFDFLQL